MQQIVLSWFPSHAFANLFGVVVLVALLMLVLLLGAALYRLRVEERLLLETFGDEYRATMQRTALLFPPW